jgi:sulfite exporter TauE/SafE
MEAHAAFTLSAAFLAGLAGGVHCAAMCGPLVGIACSARSGRGEGRWLGRALGYNAGRIATYAGAGAITGAIGAGGLALRGDPVTQQALLAVMSASLLLLAAYVAGFKPLVRGIEAAGAVAWRRIEPYSRRFLPATTPARAFGLGLVFGWLPCGMVYVMLIAALASADPLHGAAVMIAFGLGTLPNLLAIWAWFRYAAGWAKGRMARWLVAGVIAAVGTIGLAKAMEPAAVPAAASWCLSVPGIAAVFGSGGH